VLSVVFRRHRDTPRWYEWPSSLAPNGGTSSHSSREVSWQFMKGCDTAVSDALKDAHQGTGQNERDAARSASLTSYRRHDPFVTWTLSFNRGQGVKTEVYPSTVAPFCELQADVS
jgi:hypothetical protein